MEGLLPPLGTRHRPTNTNAQESSDGFFLTETARENPAVENQLIEKNIYKGGKSRLLQRMIHFASVCFRSVSGVRSQKAVLHVLASS
jgi:hypothetical protein